MGLILLCLSANSCVESLDFTQIEEFSATPVIKSSLVFFSLTSNDFIDSITGTESVTIPPDVSEFDGLDNEFMRNNLSKIVFDIEVKNEITRNFSLLVAFLDENDTVVFTLRPINVPASDLTFTFQETIDVGIHQNILNTNKVRVSGYISSSTTPLVANDPSELEFKSSITLFIQTE